MKTLAKFVLTAALGLVGMGLCAQNTVPEDGKVGLGTLSPATALHLKASDGLLRLQSTNKRGWIEFVNKTGYKGFLGIYRNENDLEFGTSSANRQGKLHFLIASKPEMTFVPDGLIGVGTMNPQTKFHVVGDALRVQAEYNKTSYLELNTDNQALSLMGVNDDLRIESTIGNTLLQPSGGGVGIGVKQVPSNFSFAVAGSAIFEEVQVDLKSDWPDYVFRAGYERLSIEDLDESIQQNGHLPWFPSASDVEQKGINVAEMHKSSTEAIEVLATYVIELQKELKTLRAELDTLKAKQ